jgi:tetratricopeptide (TPR) repeat protein
MTTDDRNEPTRHEPFEAALARTPLQTPRWFRYRAGLRVLELLDRIWSGQPGDALDQPRRTARDAIAVVRPLAARAALDAILEISAAGGDSIRGALLALVRYGDRLRYESDYALALHVYRIVIDGAAEEGLVHLLAAVCEQAATCLREQREIEAAFDHYAIGHHIAVRLGDETAELRIAIAQADLYRVEAQLDRARGILDPVLARAKALGVPELVARAAHERGNVAHDLQQYVDALGYYAEAHPAMTSEKDRSRLLNDIALSLAELGYVEDARAVWRVVYSAAKGEAYTHWAAAINLMMMAHETGDMIVFDQFAKDLAKAKMPARLRLYYLLELGEGHERFGRHDDAEQAYTRAARTACQHRFDKECQRAVDALWGRARPPATRQQSPADLPSNAKALLAVVRERHSLPSVFGRWSARDASAPKRRPLRTSLRRGRRPKSDEP